jgi:hypothetical protein
MNQQSIVFRHVGNLLLLENQWIKIILQNVVLATIEALSQLRSPEEVARLRGKSVEEILG